MKRSVHTPVLALAFAAAAVLPLSAAAEERGVAGLATAPEGVPAGDIISKVSLDECWTDSRKLTFKARLTKRHSAKVWLHVRITGINGKRSQGLMMGSSMMSALPETTRRYP